MEHRTALHAHDQVIGRVGWSPWGETNPGYQSNVNVGEGGVMPQWIYSMTLRVIGGKYQMRKGID